MRFPRVRLTMRRLLVAVAIVGVVLGMGRRSSMFRELSVFHQREALRVSRPPAMGQASLHHVDLSETYEWAARYPWLPVAPDPPEPE